MWTWMAVKRGNAVKDVNSDITEVGNQEFPV